MNPSPQIQHMTGGEATGSMRSGASAGDADDDDRLDADAETAVLDADDETCCAALSARRVK